MVDPLPSRLASSAFRGLVLIGAGAAGAHYELCSPLIGFGVSAGGCVVVAIALLALPVALVRHRGRTAIAVASLAMAAVAIAAGAYVIRHPRINDVSTDIEDPPVLEPDAQGRETWPMDPATRDVVRERYAGLQPLRVPGPMADVFPRALAAVKLRADTRDVRTLPDLVSIRVASVTRVYRFPDIYTVRVRQDGAMTRVDVRSRSKIGKGDFGVNAARIRAVLADIEKHLNRR